MNKEEIEKNDINTWVSSSSGSNVIGIQDYISAKNNNENKKIIKVHAIKKELVYEEFSIVHKGVIPKLATKGSCAYDLYYCGEETKINPGEIVILGTGIILELPDDIAGLILSRSGLSSNGLFVINAPGLIDSDYRGEIKVILCNISKDLKIIRNNDRIAQILFFEKANVELLEVNKNEITQTERGDGGIGSTGK